MSCPLQPPQLPKLHQPPQHPQPPQHILSTGASREAPVDNWARRHTSIHPYIQTCIHTYKHALSTGASREAPVDKWARRHTSIHPYILTIPLAWTCLHLPSPAPSPSSKRLPNKDEQKTILFGVHAQVSLFRQVHAPLVAAVTRPAGRWGDASRKCSGAGSARGRQPPRMSVEVRGGRQAPSRGEVCSLGGALG